MGVWKKYYCDGCFVHVKWPLKHHQFASSFEQWNFISNQTLKRKKIENSFVMFLLWCFQRYKIIVFSCCDTPCHSFYHSCTHYNILMFKIQKQMFDETNT
jgi:hypothetical protein